MLMAASTFSGQEGIEPRLELSTAPVGRGGKDRRASLVIKETAQLLNGLHQDADRSDALMAELEALLAASQSASGLTQAAATDEADMGLAQRFQFAAVEPIQIEDSDSEEAGEDAGAGEEQDEECGTAEAAVGGAEEEPAEPASPAPPQLASAPPTCTSAKRRSSVVTFDGAALFGAGLPPAASGQLVPGPPAAPRSMSFSRARAATTSAAATRSFTDKGGATLRRIALTDAGVPQQQQSLPSHYAQQLTQQQLLQPQYSGPSVSAMASALALANGVSRRPSSTDALEFVGLAQQARRSSGMSYTLSGPAVLSYGAVQSHGQVFVGTGLRDDSADGGLDALGLGAGLGLGQGGGGGGSGVGVAAARMSGGGGGHGGRFMKLLKGIFNHHSSESSASKPATPASVSPSGAAAAATATAATLESALTHGALSSMTPVRAPSRSQILVTRGSNTGTFSAVPLSAEYPNKRSGSVQRHPSIGNNGGGGIGPSVSATGSGVSSPLVGGRSSSITSSLQYNSSPHALVPTPPVSGVQPQPPPQLVLRRMTSGSGAMGPSLSPGAATPTALLSPSGSACLSPASPGTTLYGMLSPSAAGSALDCRLAGGPSRRGMNLAVGLRGQM